MENLHENMHVCVLSCNLHENTRTYVFFMYFSLFSASFYPSYIIMVKGLGSAHLLTLLTSEVDQLQRNTGKDGHCMPQLHWEEVGGGATVT